MLEYRNVRTLPKHVVVLILLGRENCVIAYTVERLKKWSAGDLSL